MRPRGSACGLLVAVALAAGCGVLDRDTRGEAVAVPARRAELRIAVPAEGYLEAVDASPVAVPRVPTGALKVKEVAPEGSLVVPGDVVLVFDDTQLSIDLSNHKASFRSADRRIDRTGLQSRIESGNLDVMREVAELERDHADTFQLVDDQLYSRAEILESEARTEVASETILYAEASLMLRGEFYDIEENILEVEKDKVGGDIERVETSLGNLVLRAPIGGLIVYKKNWRGSTVAVGDSLWPGGVIMSIVDPESTALTAFVLEKDAAGVDAGDPAVVRVDARSDHEYRGEVLKVAELARPIESGSPVKYFEVQVRIDDPDRSLLKPGMKGTAWIETGRVEDAIVIPRSAVRGEGEDRYVVVAAAGGPERRPVTLGAGDVVQVAVTDGVRDGERVLLGGVPPELEKPPSDAEGPRVAGVR
ncbi:MAG: HlyD family efflux transporter periplasmic adaptor subunit [Acidobacteriota bacterium]|jgi:HlyD family secretion protein